jgi:hypothetical protein
MHRWLLVWQQRIPGICTFLFVSSFVSRGVWFHMSPVFNKRIYGQIDGFRAKRSTFAGNRAVRTFKISFLGSILYNVRVTWPLLITSCTCLATGDAVQIVNSFITIPITRNYNHSQLFLTLLRVYTITSLHVRNYNHLFHSYTFTRFTNTTL